MVQTTGALRPAIFSAIQGAWACSSISRAPSANEGTGRPLRAIHCWPGDTPRRAAAEPARHGPDDGEGTRVGKRDAVDSERLGGGRRKLEMWMGFERPSDLFARASRAEEDLCAIRVEQKPISLASGADRPAVDSHDLCARRDSGPRGGRAGGDRRHACGVRFRMGRDAHAVHKRRRRARPDECWRDSPRGNAPTRAARTRRRSSSRSESTPSVRSPCRA